MAILDEKKELIAALCRKYSVRNTVFRRELDATKRLFMQHGPRKLIEDVPRCIEEYDVLEREILWDIVMNEIPLLKRDVQTMG